MKVIKKRHKEPNRFISKYKYEVVFTQDESDRMKDKFVDYFKELWKIKPFSDVWAFKIKHNKIKAGKSIFGNRLYNYKDQYSIYTINLEQIEDIKRYMMQLKLLN